MSYYPRAKVLPLGDRGARYIRNQVLLLEWEERMDAEIRTFPGRERSSDDTIPYGDPFGLSTQQSVSSQIDNGDVRVDGVATMVPLSIEVPVNEVSRESFACESKTPSLPTPSILGTDSAGVSVAVGTVSRGETRDNSGSTKLVQRGDNRVVVGKVKRGGPKIDSSGSICSNPDGADEHNSEVMCVGSKQPRCLSSGLGLWQNRSNKKRCCGKRVFMGHNSVFFESLRKEYFPSLGDYKLDGIMVCNGRLPFEVNDFVVKERHRMVS